MAEAKTQKTTKAATGNPPAVETDETGVLRKDADVAAAVERGEQDRVQMASRKPDGTPDQTPGFTYIDPEVAREASEKQLAEQAVSVADQAVRAPAEAGPGGGGSGEPDPAVQQIVDVHAKAAEQAVKRVASEIDEHT
jgi:hypothetical protein